MTKKIFTAILVATVAVLLLCACVISYYMYEHFGGVQVDGLWSELDMATAGVESAGMDYLKSLDSSDANRLTWIAKDGSVLYDTRADEESMGDHSERDEVIEAYKNGEGFDERYSSTLLEKTVYCAKRLSDGSVLRISVSRATIAAVALDMLKPISAVVLVSLVLAIALAGRLSKRIVDPLNELDLDHPLENQTYDELAPLLTRIDRQSKQIDGQLRQLKQKKDEFEQITNGMREGLVLLDNNGVILSMNPTAMKLFRADASHIGHDLLTVERSRDVCEAVSAAAKGGHSELKLERGGLIYQLDVNRIESDGTPIGMVLSAFDVTDKVYAERARREFTANVSHELKTPLTAILGSSELLENGMVANADIPRFVSHIHDEAARLLTLIEDIIRLSQLDEGADIPKESVDVASIAEEVADQLRDKAEKRNIALTVCAEHCVIQGVPALLYEIVYNLTDNAIKYNIDGGSVKLSLCADGVLTVADTGIGIPPEHQARVFERFYRVDKSHSKKIGGTGLGLSIVKHAAVYLGARLELNSEVGKGTVIKVIFSRKEA